MPGLLHWLLRRGRRRTVAQLPPPVDPPVAGEVPEPEGVAVPEPEEVAVPESAVPGAEPELESGAPISPARLDQALRRLRQEIPAPSEESPPGPSE